MADGLKRLSNMVKGGFDKWLDEHTDPIVDLEQDIKDGLKEYSELIGKQGVQQQRVEDARKEVNKYQGLVDRYHKIACAALNEGNELDATRALEKETEYESLLETAKATMDQHETIAHEMSMDILEYAKLIESSKVELKNLKSQLAAAEAKEAKAEFRGSFLSDGNDKLARAKGRVAARVAQADAKDKSASVGRVEDDPLFSKYDVDDNGVSAKLAALKAEMGK
ncbi:TPA: PspA/IM30 family protein [Clostridioides difficile]|nr:PspA/IM30 family protein [Clostridioides difficile]